MTNYANLSATTIRKVRNLAKDVTIRLGCDKQVVARFNNGFTAVVTAAGAGQRWDGNVPATSRSVSLTGEKAVLAFFEEVANLPRKA